MGWTERALGFGKGVISTAANLTEAALDFRNTTLNVQLDRSINVTDERDLVPMQDWLLRTDTIKEHFGNVVFTLDSVRTMSGRTELVHGDILLVDSHALMLRGIQTSFS